MTASAVNERELLGGFRVVVPACDAQRLGAASIAATAVPAGTLGPIDVSVSELVEPGTVIVIDRDSMLPDWLRAMSPWRRIRYLRYGAAGLVDPLATIGGR